MGYKVTWINGIKNKWNEEKGRWEPMNNQVIKSNFNYLQPCYKFSDAGIFKEYEKMIEEVEEVQDAIMNFELSESKQDQEALAMEVVDVMVCCTTLLHQLGLNDSARRDIYKKVYEKNEARNYYDSTGSIAELAARK